MPTIAIIGAGPGLGLAIARTFGHEGFSVALVSRTQEKLDRLAAQLGEEGITAAGFAADVTDRPSLTAALGAATEHFGSVDVLEYSPADTTGGALAPADVRSTTPDNVQPQIEYSLYGGMSAVEAVLPAMRAAGAGTIIVTTGAGSVRPAPMFGNVTVGGAALRNWALNLGAALDADDTGVHVAHVAIGVWVTDSKPADHHVPSLSPSEIAPRYWDLHTGRSTHEIVIEG
ncbi:MULTISPECIES: SDR family oxidoreductase [unclassified Curtobacterium]|uniref:SDR family NAD(P)-dependent oxidoreductase n=1 Tax=unclassified Curtobacterium TaxID=257496 RepID=UPI001AE56239|nr:MULTISPECIES: SDR family NAD(P)-dependent oxidoreductase [unclassified Curtobacterium]MBP1300393.1 NADP-dependent 3-hydroxy acid dehydrogenase YdfG [Curtobacterium sp. 1310]MCM3521627.1 SDR family NAD(P)-dependent oxidoreductase [Curtobacterium sp. P97]MDB6426764.1 SDR family NAD(P)-dependent oxidoreductase [Curtobacterium sp. 20TX0008]MDT0209397.1 SDR family NAD(P)-dependent oxidoreductase [Curtobacterium sp. BRD11]